MNIACSGCKGTMCKVYEIIYSLQETINLGGALPKNMWRVCAATLTSIFKPPVTEWPLFIFHILLSRNDPHFQNALSLNDPLF